MSFELSRAVIGCLAVDPVLVVFCSEGWLAVPISLIVSTFPCGTPEKPVRNKKPAALPYPISALNVEARVRAIAIRVYRHSPSPSHIDQSNSPEEF